MSSQYFVGIGGTGAKCLEAIVHLCAAGLGPDELWVGLVDQDISNGHVEQTEALIDSYIQTRKLLRPGDRRVLGNDCPLFKTKLVKSAPDFVWQPLPRERANLATEVFQYKVLSNDERALLDCLFTKEELDQPLDLGFRGRPALGAATFLHSEREAVFWQRLMNSIDQVTGDRRAAKLFLAGSVYGGTGAAGFPTLARLLARRAQPDQAVTGNRGRRDRDPTRILVGGSLLLPYFGFSKPTREQISRHGFMAESSAFLEQSAKALAYYFYMLKEDPIFEKLYLVGWNPQIRISGDAKPGAREQRNPPMLPELYAAAAALNFLLSPPDDDDDGERRETVVNYVCRNDGRDVTWPDIPDIAERQDVYQKLGQFIRFAHAYQGHYAPLIEQNKNKTFFVEPWFRENFRRANVQLEDSNVQDLLVKVREFCQEFLLYFSDMNFAMQNEKTNLSFIDTSQFSKTIESAATPPWTILKDHNELSKGNFGADFGSIVQKYIVSDKANGRNLTHPQMRDVLDYLVNSTKGGDAGSGPGFFLTRLYQACAY